MIQVRVCVGVTTLAKSTMRSDDVTVHMDKGPDYGSLTVFARIPHTQRLKTGPVFELTTVMPSS